MQTDLIRTFNWYKHYITLQVEHSSRKSILCPPRGFPSTSCNLTNQLILISLEPSTDLYHLTGFTWLAFFYSVTNIYRRRELIVVKCHFNSKYNFNSLSQYCGVYIATNGVALSLTMPAMSLRFFNLSMVSASANCDMSGRFKSTFN